MPTLLPDAWTTPRCLHHWAFHTPDAPALLQGPSTLTHAELAALVVRFARALSASSIGPNHLVGIETVDRITHMALILAAGLVGATSVSLSGTELMLDDPIPPRCDLLCLENPPDALPPGCRGGVMRLGPDSLRRILAQPVSRGDLDVLAVETARPAVQRLIKTSGTTGQPKVMASTDAMARAMTRIETSQPDDPGYAWHHATIYNFTFRGAQREVDLALRQGCAGVLTDVASLPAAVDRFASCRVSLMPGDIVAFAQAIPDHWRAPRPMVLAVKGGPMPASLRHLLETRAATHVEHHYATNETHILALLDRDGIARPRQEVAIRIVDPDGRVVPDGGIGLIEARSPYMVDGYAWDPVATAASFRDGWYRTSDLGRMVDGSGFALLGRADDMIVVGGIKVPPQPLEQRMRDLPGVRDAVMLVVPGPLGADRLHVVLETDQAVIAPVVRVGIATIIAPYYGGDIVIDRLDLPRTEHGKVRRADVRAMLLDRRS